MYTGLCDTDYACVIVVQSWEKIIQSMILSFELTGVLYIFLFVFVFETILLNQTPGLLLE